MYALVAANMIDEKKAIKEASIAKPYASEVFNRVADKAYKFMAKGYIGEYPIERFYRNARITKIYEGTNEIKLLVIARNVLAGD
ncbi:acyl-CoA dehydrogenase family protein [Peribacillus butanolivorans]|uniref:acyl-CoA dehydrogenase family protein n=1 Tax=Peribacillus butanolivorans TaxID=421767 RepID=UPI003647564C